MSIPFVVGVDGGNTKTLAVAATLAGVTLGAGLGGCSDVYGATSVDSALAEIEKAVRAALASGSLGRSDPVESAFCLAGADWPEDFELYGRELESRLGWRPHVLNDAIGAVSSGSPSGVGVAVACGTWGAIGARGREGEQWHSSFWMEGTGATALGLDALGAVYRAALGIGEPTSLTERLLALYGEAGPEALLHRLTRRDGCGRSDAARSAPVVLDAAAAGDPAARSIVLRHGVRLGEHALVGARKVGLPGEPFPLVLAGGVFAHASTRLAEAVVDRVRAEAPEAVPVLGARPTAVGAVLIALERAGVAVGESHASALRASLPAVQAATGGSLLGHGGGVET